MKLWNEGDRSRGVCERCGALVDTRFERRTVRLKAPPVDVPDVLVDVCATCGEIVSVPCQSSARLNEFRPRDLIKFEARVPQALSDLLGLIALRYGGRPDAFPGALLRYYLHEFSQSRELAERAQRLAQAGPAAGRLDGRVHLRLEEPLLGRAWSMAESVGIRDKSELIRGLIVAAAEEAERPKAKQKAVFEALAAAAV